MSDVERITNALQFVSAGDRVTWVKMGMAIKSELGDAGFQLWDAWSQQDDSYQARDARDVWRSFRDAGQITIGSLFHAAKAQGWIDNGRQAPTPDQIAERKRLSAERAAKEAAEIAQERTLTAAKAQIVWARATQAQADQPYLRHKQVSPTDTLRQIEAAEARAILDYVPKCGGEPLNGCLLVAPIKQGNRMSSLELIDGTGRKAALAGRGSKVGGYWASGRLPDGKGDGLTLLIGEGVATMLSVSEATGHPAVATLSAGNLVAVAQAKRERFPDAMLVICADLVKATGEPDPHAVKAAQAVDGLLAVPDFGADPPDGAKDFNDLFVLGGAETVRRAIAAAIRLDAAQPSADPENALPDEYARSVELVRGSDVVPEAINWLWPGWLAAGKLHLFGGAPGTGKTTIAMSLAATVTIGGWWPDGSKSPSGNVVMWSGEDDPGDTLVPRLALSGADLSRIFFISATWEGRQRQAFDPGKDMEPLRRKLAEIGGARLLVIDPIVSAISGDSHKNAEVRRGLQPLVDLAASFQCALLGITHFSKGTGGRDPVERLTGSLAFGAFARVVLVAAKHQEAGEIDHAARLFCRAKSNIGPDDGGFEYDLLQGELRAHPGVCSSYVQWGTAVEGPARELLATADASNDENGGTVADAKRFLMGLLADGPMRAGEIFKDADQAGYSKRSIQRAANVINIERHKDGMKGGWTWRLPPKVPAFPEDAVDAEQKFLASLAPSAASSVVEVEI